MCKYFRLRQKATRCQQRATVAFSPLYWCLSIYGMNYNIHKAVLIIVNIVPKQCFSNPTFVYNFRYMQETLNIHCYSGSRQHKHFRIVSLSTVFHIGHTCDKFLNIVPELIYTSTMRFICSQTAGKCTIITIISMFWENKPLQRFILDSFERLSMLCAKVPQPCPVPNWLCRQTRKNITQYLTSITRFVEKKQ